MKTTNEFKQKTLTNRILVVIFITAIFGLTACEQKGAAEKAGQKIDRATENAGKKIDQATDMAGKKIEDVKESVIENTKTAGDYVDDSVITTRVKSALLNDSILAASHIDVSTIKGVVKLSGTVDSEQSIGRAMEVASSQKDVKSVETSLFIKIK